MNRHELSKYLISQVILGMNMEDFWMYWMGHKNFDWRSYDQKVWKQEVSNLIEKTCEMTAAIWSME